MKQKQKQKQNLDQTFLYVAQVRSTLTHALSCCVSGLEVLFIIIIYIILVALSPPSPHTPATTHPTLPLLRYHRRKIVAPSAGN